MYIGIIVNIHQLFLAFVLPLEVVVQIHAYVYEYKQNCVCTIANIIWREEAMFWSDVVWSGLVHSALIILVQRIAECSTVETYNYMWLWYALKFKAAINLVEMTTLVYIKHCIACLRIFQSCLCRFHIWEAIVFVSVHGTQCFSCCGLCFNDNYNKKAMKHFNFIIFLMV